jgi:hypothetical protein
MLVFFIPNKQYPLVFQDKPVSRHRSSVIEVVVYVGIEYSITGRRLHGVGDCWTLKYDTLHLLAKWLWFRESIMFDHVAGRAVLKNPIGFGASTANPYSVALML